jgi:hypothetical protein
MCFFFLLTHLINRICRWISQRSNFLYWAGYFGVTVVGIPKSSFCAAISFIYGSIFYCISLNSALIDAVIANDSDLLEFITEFLVWGYMLDIIKWLPSRPVRCILPINENVICKRTSFHMYKESLTNDRFNVEHFLLLSLRRHG